ncbi:phenylacetate--CoA ligase family protein [Clostridium baratii]|uniref:phenylacetate--CoA ligase family protein n=1 Tax=Clostridium baratii TaxID=1561 RepID=UPI0030D1B95F
MSTKDKIIRMGQGLVNVEKIYGKKFKHMYDFLTETQWWSEEKLKEYQLNRLKQVIKNAYENVPYYTKLFNNYGIDAYNIKDFSDIKKIPYLTKEIIKENIHDLYNINYPKYKIEYKTTGGSTGTPMGLYQDRFYTRKVERAFVAHMWSRVGYNKDLRQKTVYLRGIRINGEYEKNGKNLILNSFLLTENNFMNYIRYIEQFNPDFINGYPSVIYILSKYILDNKVSINLTNLKSILLTSENIYDFQREAIEEAFHSRVYSFYGHTERACIGGECEESKYYHLQPEYGFTELINSNGVESEKEDELAEIVCTGFINPVMPFIRYKTNDIAINTLEKCSCGRNYKLIKRIEGRTQDFIIDKNNNIKSFTCQDEPLWEIKEKVQAYQYIQNDKGKIILNIKEKCKISDDEINRVKENFHNTFNGFILDVNFIDNIDMNKNGKFRYLIQNIKNDFFYD